MCRLSLLEPVSGVATSPCAEEVPEFNTDQGNGTHRLCQSLLQEHGDACVPDWMERSHSVSAESLRALMLQRRESARSAAESMASRALKEKLSPAEAVLSILDKRGLRRGSAKSDIGRAGCLSEIEQALAKPGPLSLAVLTFPFRDQHPLKSVGQLPDAGELESLTRFWTVATAINMCGIPCKFIALRDQNRYPCHEHFSSETKQAYGDAFREFVHGLEMDDVLEIRDADSKGPQESQKAFEARVQAHSVVYEKELAMFRFELTSHWDNLKAACTEADFAFRLSQLPSGDIFLSMFYPMLHGSCAVPNAHESDGPAGRLALLKRLLGVFKPCALMAEERERQQLLWQALFGAAQYVSAYRSRSAANNSLGLDDVAAVAPNSVRCSIHNKSKDNGAQFPLKVSSNVHRTPWHGTAELRFSKQDKSAIIDVKLAAEMWCTHDAVVPLASNGISGDSPMASWVAYCNRLAHAQQPFFFADSQSLPANWKDSGFDMLMSRTAASVEQHRPGTSKEERRKGWSLQQHLALGGA